MRVDSVGGPEPGQPVQTRAERTPEATAVVTGVRRQGVRPTRHGAGQALGRRDRARLAAGTR